MLKKIIIDNYKSIRHAEIDLNQINILIGENGAGKSNLISFLELVKVGSKAIPRYVTERLGMNRLLYGGLEKSQHIYGCLTFEQSDPSEKKCDKAYILELGVAVDGTTPFVIEEAHNSEIESLGIYHFSDTGYSSPLRRKAEIDDNVALRNDGSNLAAVLYRIEKQNPVAFRTIETTMRRIAPYFDRFDLKPDRINPKLITIEWKENNSDLYMDSTSFSDGTLRFLALCVLLMQPEKPGTIIIDEPELGLHPAAVSLFAAMVRVASRSSQVIVATQSADLLNEFSLNDVIVVERTQDQSTFRRLDETDFESWFDDYTTGEIWKKNIIGGQP